MDKEIELFIVKLYMKPSLGRDNVVKHLYSQQEISAKVKEKYGIEVSRPTVSRILKKWKTQEKFQEAYLINKKKIEEEVEEIQEEMVNTQFDDLRKILTEDLRIVKFVNSMNGKYLTKIAEKMKEDPTRKNIEEEIRILNSIGKASSDRIMKLIEIVFNESKKYGDIKIEFNKGVDFND